MGKLPIQRHVPEHSTCTGPSPVHGTKTQTASDRIFMNGVDRVPDQPGDVKVAVVTRSLLPEPECRNAGSLPNRQLLQQRAVAGREATLDLHRDPALDVAEESREIRLMIAG